MATRGRETEKSVKHAYKKKSSARDQIIPASENSVSIQTDPEDNRLNLDRNKNEPRYVFSTDIPDTYEENYVCAIPKNPEWMFVYWELSSTSQTHLKTSLNGETGQTVLKLTEWNKASIPSQPETTSRYPVAVNAPATQHISLHKPATHIDNTAKFHFDMPQETFHIGVNSTAGESYIRIPVPGKEYRFEFGQVVPPGIYMPLSDSDHKSIPDSVVEKTIDEYTPKNNNDESLACKGTLDNLHIEDCRKFNAMNSPASICRNDGSSENPEASLDKQSRPDISSESSCYLGSAVIK